MNRDSVVNSPVVIRYGVDGPGIEGGLNFRTRPGRPKGPNQPPIQWIPGLCWGVKRPGDSVDHPPHLAPRLKKGYSYNSAPPLGLRSYCSVNFLYLYITGLFNDNFKHRNCPSTRRASATNSIDSDTAVFNGRSVAVNNLLLSDILLHNSEILSRSIY